MNNHQGQCPDVKVSNWYLLYLSAYGRLIDYDIVEAERLAPEQLVVVSTSDVEASANGTCTEATDVWCIGLLLLELYTSLPDLRTYCMTLAKAQRENSSAVGVN